MDPLTQMLNPAAGRAAAIAEEFDRRSRVITALRGALHDAYMAAGLNAVEASQRIDRIIEEET